METKMNHPFSLRLDDQAKHDLERMAKATRRSRAYLINQAIHSFAKANAGSIDKALEAEKPKKAKFKSVNIDKYIGSMSGTFGSVEEIDAYIANERASWD